MRKSSKLILLFLAFALCLAGWPASMIGLNQTAHAAGGSGTLGDPFIIETADELNEIRNTPDTTGVAYELGADIDLSNYAAANGGKGWEPLFTVANGFKGRFNGNGHTISGLTINRADENDVGLFGVLDGAWVLNLKLEGVVTGKTNVGGLAGQSINNTRISSVAVDIDVEGESSVGGIVGHLESPAAPVGLWDPVSEIWSSMSKGTVKATNHDGGGLVGTMVIGSISGSYSLAALSGQTLIGGLIGSVSGAGNTLKYSYAAGPNTGNATAGGLVGSIVGSLLVTKSYWDTTVTGKTGASGDPGADTSGGKTSAELKIAYGGIYSGGWDPEGTWYFYDGYYPFLQWTNPLDSIVLEVDNLTLKMGGNAVLQVLAQHQDGSRFGIPDDYVSIDFADEGIVGLDGSTIYAIKPGTTTITFRYMGEYSVTLPVKVLGNKPPVPYYPVTNVSLNQPNLTLTAGGTAQRLLATVEPSYATIQQVTWSSSNPEVATVDENGLVTPKKVGETTVSVTTVDGAKTATSRVVVKQQGGGGDGDGDGIITKLVPSERTLLVKPNRTTKVKIFAVYENGYRKEITLDKETKFSSSSKTVTAQAGKIKSGKKEEEAVVTVTYYGHTLKLPVTVSKISVKSLAIFPKTVALDIDETLQLELTATMSNKKTKDVAEWATWSTSDPKIVDVSETGELKAVAPGNAKVTVIYGGKKAELNVEVAKGKKLKRLQLSKRVVGLKAKQTEQITLTAVYADGTKKEITEDAKWSSDDEAIAEVKAGLITAKTIGKTKITAKYKSKKVTVTVTVRK